MEFEYNERKYIVENNKYRIESDKQKECSIPENFTKYYAISEYSIDALLKNYLYASHPYELNDPFDCFRYLIDASNKTQIEMESNYNPNDKIKNFKPEIFLTTLHEINFRNIGLISLSDSKNENPILWAHYTNNHKGFSVTFESNSFNQLIGPFQIDYLPKLKKIKFEKEKYISQFFCSTLIKSDKWDSEEEYRYLYLNQEMYIPGRDYGDVKIRNQENRKFYLPKNSIKEIKLGFYFFDDINNVTKNNLGEFVVDLSKEADSKYKKKLISFASSNNIPLKKMYLNKDNFTFTAESIEYEYIPDANCFKYKRIE